MRLLETRDDILTHEDIKRAKTSVLWWLVGGAVIGVVAVVVGVAVLQEVQADLMSIPVSRVAGGSEDATPTDLLPPALTKLSSESLPPEPEPSEEALPACLPNCRNADLAGADLRRADLAGVELDEADLRGAILLFAILNDANLSRANLRGADLRGANLRGAVLIEADLRGAVLIEANLSGAILSHANLIEANLSGAILRGADLVGADLTNTEAISIGPGRSQSCESDRVRLGWLPQSTLPSTTD